jgi:hypothetical protein
MITIHISTVSDKLSDFDQLFKLWDQVNSDALDVSFNFTYCGFLSHNAVAFLGGLMRLVQHRGGIVRIDWDSMRNDVRLNLGKNNFRDAFGDKTLIGIGNSIPYREDLIQDSDRLIDYLKTKWLGRGWVHVSPLLRDAIVGRVWEIYANAFEHSQSSIGIFSCGQHYPRRRDLSLTVVDYGVGIPSNVRIFARNQNITADTALQWAFQRGTTTKPNGTSRGMGLDLLKEFVKLNKGRLEIFSHEGYALIDETQETFVNRQTFFEGTVVNITFRCDESYYRFASETPEGPIF